MRVLASKTGRAWSRVAICVLSLLGIGIGSMVGSLRADAAELNVYAAVSLTESLQEIAARHEKRSGDRVVFNLGASNALARQIEAGAPADLFFSADEAQMDRLEKQGLLLEGTRRSVLSNQLVIVVPRESRLAIRSAADLARPEVASLALAEPQSVPAGIYAKEFLKRQGVWKQVIDKVIPTENVRAALAAVTTGNVDAAIVYKTDAYTPTKLRVAYEVPVEDAPAISYPVAVLRQARDADAARRFLALIESQEGRDVFVKQGFIDLVRRSR